MIRLSQLGDGPAVGQLFDMAMHGNQGPEGSENFPALADGGMPDVTETALASKSRGITKTTPSLLSLRIMDTDGEAVGLVHCAPPLTWILRKSGLPLGSVAKLISRFTELNLLAVLPEHRHKGHGTALLTDAIDRYQDAGYTAMSVLVEEEADARLKPWYEKQGFVFAPLGSPFELRFWSHRGLYASCSFAAKNQYLGVLPLSSTVTVDTYPVSQGLPPLITGVLD
jgi:GNAT superfamily N-acetyltransferase